MMHTDWVPWKGTTPPKPKDRVYFMRRPDGCIKIGYTNHIVRRKRALEKQRGEELTLLGVLPGALRREQEIQYQFRFQQIEREWFLPTGELKAFIAETATELYVPLEDL